MRAIVGLGGFVVSTAFAIAAVTATGASTGSFVLGGLVLVLGVGASAHAARSL